MPILQGPGGRRVRLAYCANVHPGETLEAVEQALDRYAVRVRERLGLARMGVGLWLAAPVARRLASEAQVARAFRGFLEERGLLAFTANAFPIGGFHAPRVKAEVYRPSWLEVDRARFTADVARALARILPDGEAEATISTLPVAWRGHVHDATAARRASLEYLRMAIREMAKIRAESGIRVRLAIEPEPGCVVETTEEAIALFLEIHAAWGAERDLAREHLALCFDCCHQAVMGEDLPASLAKLRAAGISVAKAHLSSAVEGAIGDMAALAEPRYLHQVVTSSRRADDLESIARDPAWQAERARCHFHVPIYAEHLASGLATTRPALEAALGAILDAPEAAPDLEIETYTWTVLPESERPRDLADGIAREMEWALARLAERGWRPL